MKAKDLMIGDWVYGLYPNGERYAIPFRISAIDIYPLNRSPRIVTMGGYGFQQEHLAPIPLTPEILEKNGFTDCETTNLGREMGNTFWYPGKDNFISNSALMINLMKNSFLIRFEINTIYRLRFVHELQHAFRLLGIEKEIEL